MGRLRIRSSADFTIGVVGIVLSLVALWLTKDLLFKDGFNVGPGYLPRIVCAIILLISISIVVSSIASDGPKLERVAWRPFLVVVASVIVFGFMIERFGLVAASIVTVVIGSFAGERYSFWKVLVLAVLLAIGAVLLFVYGLNVPFKVYPW